MSEQTDIVIPEFDPSAPDIWEDGEYELNPTWVGAKGGINKHGDPWYQVTVQVEPIDGELYAEQADYGLEGFFVSEWVPGKQTGRSDRRKFEHFRTTFGLAQGDPLLVIDGKDDEGNPNVSIHPDAQEKILNATDVYGWVSNEASHRDPSTYVNTVLRWGRSG